MNGLIQRTDWISAAIGDAIGDLLSPPGRKPAAPAPLPLRAFAVRKQPVSMKLLGQDISSAFKTIAEPILVATCGREASMLSGGEVPIFVPRAGNPDVVGWHEFGLQMKFLPQILDNSRIALGIDFLNSELNEPKAGAGDSSIRLISSQGFRLSAQMKLSEQLLVAQQTDQHDVTRLVQIQPLLPIDLLVDVQQARDEAASGIVELAEQFAPKVLKRLKIGAVEQAASD